MRSLVILIFVILAPQTVSANFTYYKCYWTAPALSQQASSQHSVSIFARLFNCCLAFHMSTHGKHFPVAGLIAR